MQNEKVDHGTERALPVACDLLSLVVPPAKEDWIAICGTKACTLITLLRSILALENCVDSSRALDWRAIITQVACVSIRMESCAPAGGFSVRNSNAVYTDKEADRTRGGPGVRTWFCVVVHQRATAGGSWFQCGDGSIQNSFSLSFRAESVVQPSPSPAASQPSIHPSPTVRRLRPASQPASQPVSAPCAPSTKNSTKHFKQHRFTVTASISPSPSPSPSPAAPPARSLFAQL
ncbi:hypothetical protein CC78DRAFT_577685 [Lojkania enalia]|uniref:Uncharacterized protein n=1 Tax=Lojkania enalia TaxID=147567 RepID=A0A9P4KDT7_9PLEO|nr:hypothetical protein CC78DRAFT_577685 [Didymosphaeria enalia]